MLSASATLEIEHVAEGCRGRPPDFVARCGYTSMLLAVSALLSMNLLRGSTSSPISVVKI